MTSPPSPRPIELDPLRLEQFLRDTISGLDGPMAIARVAGGQSNPTYFVNFASRALVLRKQPDAEILPSAHAIDREHRIITALAATDVPVPRALFFHTERDIVGTPFYVMERLEGRVFHDGALPAMATAERRAIYLAMAETMAKLHRVDWAAIGLADFGRPGNYFSRQIARWTRQWELSKNRDSRDIDRLIAWLPEHIPESDETTIVHGDFRLGNLMFHPSEPRVVGLLDWELSTLGHPLSDVAFNCLAWRTTPDEYGGIRGLDYAALGIPSEEEYLRHYYHCAGRTSACGVTPFHFAFALFRFAVIFEGIALRARQGNAAADNAAEVAHLSAAFAKRAVEVVNAAT